MENSAPVERWRRDQKLAQNKKQEGQPLFAFKIS